MVSNHFERHPRYSTKIPCRTLEKGLLVEMTWIKRYYTRLLIMHHFYSCRIVTAADCSVSTTELRGGKNNAQLSAIPISIRSWTHSREPRGHRQAWITAQLESLGLGLYGCRRRKSTSHGHRTIHTYNACCSYCVKIKWKWIYRIGWVSMKEIYWSWVCRTVHTYKAAVIV